MGQPAQTFKTPGNWVNDIAAFHTKFGVNTAIQKLDADKLRTFLKFRIDFLQEELDEMKAAYNKEPGQAAEDVVDALIDLCVVAIGTLNAFNVDSQLAWSRVDEKNMMKMVGVNPNRPNLLGLPDLIKPAGWQSPSHSDNVGLLSKLF